MFHTHANPIYNSTTPVQLSSIFPNNSMSVQVETRAQHTLSLHGDVSVFFDVIRITSAPWWRRTASEGFHTAFRNSHQVRLEEENQEKVENRLEEKKRQDIADATVFRRTVHR